MLEGQACLSRRALPVLRLGRSRHRLLSKFGFAPPIQGTRVGRPWRQRIEDLFACQVDYTGKTLLDAGGNVGILA